jgi:hypothetical protein
VPFIDDLVRNNESKQIIRKVIGTVRVANGSTYTGKAVLDAEICVFMDDLTQSFLSKSLLRKVIDELQETLRSTFIHFTNGAMMLWYLAAQACNRD